MTTAAITHTCTCPLMHVPMHTHTCTKVSLCADFHPTTIWRHSQKCSRLYNSANHISHSHTNVTQDFFLLADLIHIKQENISLQLNFILCEAYGIERVMSRPYHPQTNGLFERTNRTLQERLSKVANQSNWDKVSSHFLCTQEKYFIERYRIQFMSIKIFSISKDLDSFPLQKICCSLFGCLYLNYL